MKAEERHKLQTNALADRLGRFIQRVKQGPSRGTVTTVFLVLILAGLVFFFFWTRTRSRAAQADAWVDLYTATPGLLGKLTEKETQTAPGRAARFQFAFLHLYQIGARRITQDPAGALDGIKQAQKRYRELADEVKDDPIWGPEALYGIAVAEECLAVEDTTKRLDTAMRLYQEVADRYPTSALGKASAKRAAELSGKGPQSRRIEIEAVYGDLDRLTAAQREIARIQQQLHDELKKK